MEIRGVMDNFLLPASVLLALVVGYVAAPAIGKMRKRRAAE